MRNSYPSGEQLKLGEKWSQDIFDAWEGTGIPRNTEDVLEKMRTASRSIRYDLISYIWMDLEIDGTIANGWGKQININKIGLSSALQKPLTDALFRYKSLLDKEDIDGKLTITKLQIYLRERNLGKFILDIVQFPSILRWIHEDAELEAAWEQEYLKPSAVLLKNNIGNCLVFTRISKDILESAIKRYNLPISKVLIFNTYNTYGVQHSVLHIYTPDGIIVYDPLDSIYQ